MNGISKEKNWTTVWPKEGPKQLWKANVGMGFSSVSVSEGSLYTMGNKDDADTVFHTYSTYGRGVEVMMGTYDLLDLTPKGRDERNPNWTMDWIRHHDRYELAPASRPAVAAVAASGGCCHAQE